MANDDDQELTEYEVDDGSGGTYTVQVTKAEAKKRDEAAKAAEAAAGDSESAAKTVHTTADAKAATAANKRRQPNDK